MATPVGDSFAVASGGVIAGGRYRWPAWRRAMSAGIVAQIGSNKLSDINPANNPAINPNHPATPEWQGAGGQSAVVNAWCGACWDEQGGRLWLPLSGGHGDYAGNEGYKVRLFDESPAWEMTRPPSGAIGNLLTTNDGQEATGNYSDGRPRAIHSYNKHVYVPGVGPLCIVQGNTAWSAADGSARSLLLNESTGEFTAPVTHPSAGASTSGAAACYDESRHCVWYRAASDGRMHKLDIASWTWNTNGSWQYDSAWNYKKLIYLPEHDVVLQVDEAKTGGFALWNLTAGNYSTPGATNAAPTGLTWGGAAGVAWDGSRLLVWNNTTGYTHKIFTLTPGASLADPWTWGELSFSGVTPSVAPTNGTYGRFAYSPRLNGCLLQNETTQKTYFFAIE